MFSPSIAPTNPFTLDLPRQKATVLPINSHRFIEFHGLAPFERVTHQFHEWGLSFDGAVVIVPSNSSFIGETQKLVAVPAASNRHITINLQTPVHQATVWVRGYRSIHLSALDKDGHCLALSLTDSLVPKNTLPSGSYYQSISLQKMAIEVSGIHRLVLESKSSFVLEAVQL